MALNWYIDAWAPTDGLVFASQRGQSEDPWENDAVEAVMTFAIAAPNFEAQPVDRSAAFGAVRRGFQERFSINGEDEFDFESLNQLIAFARRIYAGSGPGTLGGGGVEPPPEPGPAPESGGAPDWFASEFLGLEMDDRRGNGSELLGALNNSPNAERGRVLKPWLTPQVTQAASRLLIEFAAGAGVSGFLRESSRLIDVAACLTTSIGELNALRSLAHERDQKVVEIMARSYASYRYPGLALKSHDSWKPDLAQVAQAPIPARFVKALGLPPTVRTMLDAVSYVAADRRFVVRSSLSGLLPVLLAVAANFRAHAQGFVWYDHITGTQSIDHLLDDCSRFIANWLPVDELPIELEQEVHRWCWRGPRDQRG